MSLIRSYKTLLERLWEVVEEMGDVQENESSESEGFRIAYSKLQDIYSQERAIYLREFKANYQYDPDPPPPKLTLVKNDKR